MVKASHDGDKYGHQRSPRPGNSPGANGSGTSSRATRNRQASARLRQSLGLPALRDNYSQLLHEFAEWSIASPVNKQSKVSSSCCQGAITPEAPVPHRNKVQQKHSRRLSQPRTSEPQPDGQHTSIQGAPTAQGEAPQQDRVSSGPFAQVAVWRDDHLTTPVRASLSQHVHLRSPRSARGAAAKRRSQWHEPKAPSSAGNPSRPRRKHQPRPAWRSSIDLSGIQQQEESGDIALQEDAALQTEAVTFEQPPAEAGVATPGAQHLIHVAVDRKQRTQQQRIQQQHITPFQDADEPSEPASAEEPLQRTAHNTEQAPAGVLHAVADDQPMPQQRQQQQQERQHQKQLVHMESGKRGQHKQDVQPAAQTAAQQQLGHLQQPSTVGSVFSAVKRVIMGRKSKSQITDEPVSPSSAAAAAPQKYDSSMVSSPQPPATQATMTQQDRTQRHGNSKTAVAAASSQQEHSQRPGPRRKSRVSDSGAAVQPQASDSRGQAGKVPMLPLQHVQATAALVTATSQTAAGSHSSARPPSSSAAQTGSISNNKQRTTPSGGAAAARVDSVEVPELLPGGVTYRRHSAADADQGNSDDAGPASVRQAGLAVAPRLGNDSRINGNGASSSTVDTRESLQHIKQLQAMRRRSVGPQVSDSALAVNGVLPASTAVLPPGAAGDQGYVQGRQQPHHRRSGSCGSSASSKSGGGLQPLPQRSNSFVASSSPADVSGDSSNSGGPDSRPSWPASRRGSSTQLPPLDEGAVLVMPAVAAMAGASATAGPAQLPPILPPGSRRGSRTDEALSTNSNSSTQQQATESQWSAAVDGPLDPGSSGVNLMCEDSLLGPGLNHELSSYGVCGDNPAGAVQLSRGAIPQKLARLKGRVSSRQLTTDEDGQPIGPGPAVVDEAAHGLPSWSGAVAVASDPGSAAASAASDSGVVMQHNTAHHGHSRSAGGPDHAGCQEQAPHDRHPQATLLGQSEHKLPVEQQHHTVGGSAGRPRARWHIPDAAVALEPPALTPAAPQQHFPQQPLPLPPDYYHVQQQLMPQNVQQAPPPPSEHQQHRWPPLQSTDFWQQHNHHHQLQQQGVYHGRQHPLPTRSASCKQPTHFGEQQHVQVHDQHTQHGKMGQSRSFTHSGQQQHCQRQQQWSEHPGQMGGWGQPPLLEHQQFWPPQQQQWGQPATWLAWQQQQQHYQPPPQLPAPGGSTLTGALPPLNFMPPHPSLEQYRLPIIEGRRQTKEPLPAYLLQPQGPAGAAASSRPPAAMPGTNINAAAATTAAMSAFSATAECNAGPGGYVAPPAGALSRFTDPWAQRQQQGQQAADIYQAHQQPYQQHMHPDQQPQQHSVASAAAVARQRQEAQKAAFEGMSLEDVLKTAKKAKPPSFGAKARHSAPDVEPSAEHEALCSR